MQNSTTFGISFSLGEVGERMWRGEGDRRFRSKVCTRAFYVCG